MFILNLPVSPQWIMPLTLRNLCVSFAPWRQRALKARALKQAISSP
jgi:hypothetical protein